MIVLDTTIVNVALPSIRTDLGFSETSLAWVVNAYLLTFGGFLLLGGRLGDLYGHRRLFICRDHAVHPRLALRAASRTSQALLVTARAVQGIGGALASAVSLSLMMTLFTEPAERAKAMGVFGFVASGGGSIGVLLGGILTNSLDWHWIFLVNIPIGIVVVALSMRLLPRRARSDRHGAPRRRGCRDRDRGADARRVRDREREPGRLDLRKDTWRARRRRRVARGLPPDRVARQVTADAARPAPAAQHGHRECRQACFWAAAMFAWFFLSALYLQLVLGYTPLQVGLAFLPANLIMGALSIGLSAKLVMRFGIKPPLGVGLVLAACGLALFARAPVHGSFLVDVLPSMILLGIGAGIAFNPMLLAAMSDVAPEEAGLASGIVNTAFMMGGALGLAVLASVAASRTGSLRASGHGELAALVGGYHVAFIVGAIFAASAATIGVTFLRSSPQPAYEGGEAPAGAEFSS